MNSVPIREMAAAGRSPGIVCIIGMQTYPRTRKPAAARVLTITKRKGPRTARRFPPRQNTATTETANKTAVVNGRLPAVPEFPPLLQYSRTSAMLFLP